MVSKPLPADRMPYTRVCRLFLTFATRRQEHNTCIGHSASHSQCCCLSVEHNCTAKHADHRAEQQTSVRADAVRSWSTWEKAQQRQNRPDSWMRSSSFSVASIQMRTPSCMQRLVSPLHKTPSQAPAGGQLLCPAQHGWMHTAHVHQGSTTLMPLRRPADCTVGYIVLMCARHELEFCTASAVSRTLPQVANSWLQP